MKNKDLYTIKDVISQVKDKGTNKFKLALIINEIEIDKRIEALDKLNEQSKELKEFEEKRREIMSKYAEKYENGNVKVYSAPGGKGEIKTDGYGFPNITKDKEAYDKEIQKLNEDNKKLLEKEAEKQKAFLSTLEQNVSPEISLNMIEFENLPELEFDQMKILMPIINR